jgi:hypothetical protein
MKNAPDPTELSPAAATGSEHSRSTPAPSRPTPPPDNPTPPPYLLATSPWNSQPPDTGSASATTTAHLATSTLPHIAAQTYAAITSNPYATAPSSLFTNPVTETGPCVLPEYVQQGENSWFYGSSKLFKGTHHEQALKDLMNSFEDVMHKKGSTGISRLARRTSQPSALP